jgi:hypothetical protein
MGKVEQALVDGLNSVDLVVADGNKFKIKLGIGEDAYSSLRLSKTLQTLWDIKGAGAAGATAAASPAGAATFFGTGGSFLSVFGIGAAAATPVGWVVAAAVMSGTAYYGAMKMLSSYSSSRTETIPKFINTPIDLLGATLFDMMAGLGLKVAEFGGEIDDEERESIVAYFEDEWGLSREYTQRAIPLIESQIKSLPLKDMVKSLADFQIDNPDCNPSIMRKDIKQFLEEIAFSDGDFDEREELAIETIERELSKHLATHKKVIRTAGKHTTAFGNVAKQAGASTFRRANGLIGGLRKQKDKT